MSATTTGTNAPDTSPEGIEARRRRRIFERQDRAAELRRSGMTNREVGREMDETTQMAERMASVSWRRASIVEASLAPCDVDSYELTAPEIMLLEALTIATFSLMMQNEVRMPESRVVGPIARRSQGWVSSTARRRIGVRIAGPGPAIKATGMTGRIDADVPGLGLVEIRGNGYLEVTDKGWPVSRALFPEHFA